jgi:PPOX class probable F420-dependent enzyme
MTIAPTAPTLDELGSAKYVSLTTYRKDGTAVPTPVWMVRDGDELAVWTNARTGKVKRIRRNPDPGLARPTRHGHVGRRHPDHPGRRAGRSILRPETSEGRRRNRRATAPDSSFSRRRAAGESGPEAGHELQTPGSDGVRRASEWR